MIYRLNRIASCMTLGSVVVLVMLPNAAEPKLPFGWLNAGVLVTLNNSARNSMPVSRNRVVCFTRARSRSRYAGPRTGLRDADPRVNCGAVANAAILKNCEGFLSPGERDSF